MGHFVPLCFVVCMCLTGACGSSFTDCAQSPSQCSDTDVIDSGAPVITVSSQLLQTHTSIVNGRKGGKGRDDGRTSSFDILEPFNGSQKLAPVDALSLYQSLHVVASLLDRHNITYWATDGTLLGAVRGAGVIPHDDDWDVVALEEDLPRINSSAFRDDLAMNGLYLFDPEICENGWQWWIKEVDGTGPKDGYGDIFVLQRRNGTLRGCSDDYFPEGWPLDAMHHLEAVPFGSVSVMAPEKDISVAFLKKIYGEDCLTVAECPTGTGAAHGCNVTGNQSWELHGKVMPCSPMQNPLFK